MAPHGVTLLGDDLYSNQPFCQLVLQHGCNFIFTCKPDSQATLYERLTFWQATDAMAEREVHRWNGRFTEVTLVRYLNDVFLRSGDDALSVNWFAITVVNAKTGEQLYHNSCITNHRPTADNVVDVAQSGRGRWKIENENNNVLKTKGYHLENNFGHGTQYLSAFLLSLNLLAFLFHPVLRHDIFRRQSNDLCVARTHHHRGDRGMIVEDLAIAELTLKTVLAMDGFGRKIVGAIEGHQELRTKDPKRRQHAVLFQPLKDLHKHRLEVAWGDWIEQLADLIITGNLLHVEEGVGVILPFGLVEPTLVFQKRRRLGEKEPKGVQGSIVDGVLGIGTRFAMVRQVHDSSVQDAFEGLEA
jgi:hypothetical protein